MAGHAFVGDYPAESVIIARFLKFWRKPPLRILRIPCHRDLVQIPAPFIDVAVRMVPRSHDEVNLLNALVRGVSILEPELANEQVLTHSKRLEVEVIERVAEHRRTLPVGIGERAPGMLPGTAHLRAHERLELRLVTLCARIAANIGRAVGPVPENRSIGLSIRDVHRLATPSQEHGYQAGQEHAGRRTHTRRIERIQHPSRLVLTTDPPPSS